MSETENEFEGSANFAPTAAEINQLFGNLDQHGKGWVRAIARTNTLRNEIIAAAFRLYRLAMRDEMADNFIRGKLDKSDIGGTKRTPLQRRLVVYAFRKAGEAEQPEPSRLTRWAGTVYYLYHCVPGDSLDGTDAGVVAETIKEHGGEAECAASARKAIAKAAGASATPEPSRGIPISCDLPATLDGKVVTVRQTETGGWELVPRKVRLSDTEAEPEPAEGEAA